MSMNLQKTKIMSSANIFVTIENLEVVDEYVYLGHNIKLRESNQTAEITRRISLMWAAFGRLSYILLEPKIPINFERKVYDMCILPVATYGLETVILTVNSANRLRICQRAMERTMLKISLRDKIRNEEIKRRTGVADLKGWPDKSGDEHVARNNIKWIKEGAS